jgi:acetate kinase
MNILILNCGSSSIKFQIAGMPDYNVIIQGSVERIGYKDAEFKFSLAKKKTIQPVLNHEEGINLIINTLFKSNLGIEAKDINAIGHRVRPGQFPCIPIPCTLFPLCKGHSDLLPLKTLVYRYLP